MPTAALVTCSARQTLPQERLLARFRFSGQLAPHELQLPAAVLDSNFASESWYAARPLHSGHTAGVNWRANEELAFGHIQLSDSEPQIAARQAYACMGRVQQQLGLPQILRAWHFLSDINAGEGDAERYKLFCSGRREALDEIAHACLPLPAATMVGADKPGFTLQFLLCRNPLQPIENPRQISAYRYPRQYGPRQPAFARAALTPGAAPRCLLISGTASIVGHATRHEGDVAAQLQESFSNVETLLQEAGLGRGDPERTRIDVLRVYLRHAEDLETARRVVRERVQNLPQVYIRADLCRQDLLAEIEAVVTG